jgi:hypothetical protein
MVLGIKRSNSKTETTAPSIDWPGLNDLVWVRLPCCESAIHPSRVEDHSGDSLVIAAPWKPHEALVPPPSEPRPFLVGWKSGTSTKQLRASFVADASQPVPTWTISAASEIETVQRRRFVRGLWDAPVTVHLPMADIEGAAADVSEGGLRVVIPETNEPRHSYFHASFVVEGVPLKLDVEVAWWSLPKDGFNQIGLEFVGLDMAMRDRLRKLAFSLQMAERQSEDF